MTADIRKLAVRESTHGDSAPDVVLSDQVRLAMRTYFARLDGHEATNLYDLVMNEVEKPLIETVLEQCGHNQSKAALVLGLSRSTLRKKMTQHGIE